MTVTHVTEFGLGVCAGVSPFDVDALEALGFAWGAVACGAKTEGDGTLGRFNVLRGVPTCPRCAVLRDEALEGRLPERK